MAWGQQTAHSPPDSIHADSLARQDSGEAGQAAVRWGRVSANWLAHPDIDADGMAILAALATYADRDGRCWPSQTTLANLLKRSRSWVNKVITRLADIGLVTVHDRWSANGGRLSSLYQLTDQPVPASEAPNSASNSASNSGSNAGERSLSAPVVGKNTPCSPQRHKHQNPEHIKNTLASRTSDARTGADGGKAASGKTHSGAENAGQTDSGSGQVQPPLLSVPADWQPETSDLTWANAAYPQIDAAEHARLFALRCQAHGYRYRDIAAAWKAWLVEDVSRSRSTTRTAARGSDTSHASVRTAPPRQNAARTDIVRPAMAEANGRVDAWAAVAARLSAGRITGPAGSAASQFSPVALSHLQEVHA